MIVYHLSETLPLHAALQTDHQQLAALAMPFVQALQKSEDCYYAMVLNGRYLRAVLRKSGLREWSDYVKWSVEGAFEYVRRTAFAGACSRLACCYFYDSLANCQTLFWEDWGEATAAERAAIHLYEIELADEAPERRDMRLYDEAYTAMEDRQDVAAVLACARRYFAGEASAAPVWELLSDKPARAVRDLTASLAQEKGDA